MYRKIVKLLGLSAPQKRNFQDQPCLWLRKLCQMNFQARSRISIVLAKPAQELKRIKLSTKPHNREQPWDELYVRSSWKLKWPIRCSVKSLIHGKLGKKFSYLSTRDFKSNIRCSNSNFLEESYNGRYEFRLSLEKKKRENKNTQGMSIEHCHLNESELLSFPLVHHIASYSFYSK